MLFIVLLTRLYFKFPRDFLSDIFSLRFVPSSFGQEKVFNNTSLTGSSFASFWLAEVDYGAGNYFAWGDNLSCLLWIGCRCKITF